MLEAGPAEISERERFVFGVNSPLSSFVERLEGNRPVFEKRAERFATPLLETAREHPIDLA